MSAIRDWAAYWIVILTPHAIMPGYRGGLMERLYMALLPHAGAWAYRS